MRSYVFIILGLSIFLLTGCDVSTKTDIYIGDIAELQSKDKDVAMTNMKICFEIDKDDFFEKKKVIEKVMQKFFTVKGEMRFNETEGDEVAEATIVVPLSKKPMVGAFYYLNVYLDKDDIFISPIFNRENLKVFSDAMGKALDNDYFSLSPDDIEFHFQVINDLRGDVTVGIRSCYVDGKPVPLYLEKKLGRRDSASLKLSKVARDAVIQQDDKVCFLKIELKK